MQGMENASIFFNTSNSNINLLGEFPYWRPTLALALISFISILGGSILILYLPLLVVLLKTKKSNFKSLNLIHLSLLISIIVEDILQLILYFVYLPSIYRYCICSPIVGIFFIVVSTFFQVYRPVIFAYLAVLQLLTILGKKKYVHNKTTVGVISLSIGVSLIFIAPIVQVVHSSGERIICDDILCPNGRPQSAGAGVMTKVLISFIASSLLPSLVVVFVSSIWSYVVFKNYYTGGDDQLNRRMISLPIVMPLAIAATSLVEILVLILIGRLLLMLPLGEYSPYWMLTIQSEILLLFRIFTGVTYPSVLVYTHSHIRQALKKLLRSLIKKCTNRVTPEGSNS